MGVPLFAIKVCGKAVLNAVLPGSGTVVDFVEALKDAYEGNYVGACLNVATGALDLVTLGAVSAAKDTAKKMGKEALIDFVKASKKDVYLRFGPEAAKIYGKETGRKLAKEFSKGMIEDVTENAFKQSLCIATTKGAVMGFIGSGGKNATAAILEGGAYELLSGVLAGGRREVSKSAFSSTVKSVIEPMAEDVFKTSLKRELALNAAKGTAQILL